MNIIISYFVGLFLGIIIGVSVGKILSLRKIRKIIDKTEKISKSENYNFDMVTGRLQVTDEYLD